MHLSFTRAHCALLAILGGGGAARQSCAAAMLEPGITNGMWMWFRLEGAVGAGSSASLHLARVYTLCLHCVQLLCITTNSSAAAAAAASLWNLSTC
jgi:hypothetical protein